MLERTGFGRSPVLGRFLVELPNLPCTALVVFALDVFRAGHRCVIL